MTVKEMRKDLTLPEVQKTAGIKICPLSGLPCRCQHRSAGECPCLAMAMALNRQRAASESESPVLEVAAMCQ